MNGCVLYGAGENLKRLGIIFHLFFISILFTLLYELYRLLVAQRAAEKCCTAAVDSYARGNFTEVIDTVVKYYIYLLFM